jgi:hypothetical protein
MAAMTIRFKKNRDGSVAFTCARPDGTATWQRNEGGNAHFFAYHDLTHYAVETELGHQRGFFGLVAEGWDLADFGSPWPRGPIPADADPSELIVGFLDGERAMGQALTGAQLAEQTATFFASRGIDADPPALTDADLARIRARRAELFARWQALPPGETLELEFALSG